MNFDIPDRNDLDKAAGVSEDQTKPVEKTNPPPITFGNTQKDRSEVQSLQQRAESADSSSARTIIGGAQPKETGRPPVRARKFGKKKTIGWVTYEAQAGVFEELLKQSTAESRTNLFELAVACLVREHLEKGHFDDIDIELAQDATRLQ